MGNISDDMLKDHRDAFFADWEATADYIVESRSVNYDTGAATITGTSEALTCVTTPVTDRQVQGSNGRYFVGDRYFKFRTEELPEDPPKTSSRIVYGGVSYRVISHDRSCQNHVTLILARKNKET